MFLFILPPSPSTQSLQGFEFYHRLFRSGLKSALCGIRIFRQHQDLYGASQVVYRISPSEYESDRTQEVWVVAEKWRDAPVDRI